MHFSLHQPPPALAPWVKSIWRARGTQQEFAQPEPIAPDGCVEMIFNLADPFADGTGAQPLAMIAGQMTRPVIAVPTGDVDLIGIRMQPGRAGAAFAVPMWELRDRLVDASSVIHGSARLLQMLHDVPREARLDCLSVELSRRFARRRMADTTVTDRALAIIGASSGRAPIDRIAQAVGVTRRQLERRFKAEVGLGAKQLARIMRVHAALRLIERQPRLSGAEISAHCGYSDQAHLIRECKALTGRTPAALMTTERSFAVLMRAGAAVRST